MADICCDKHRQRPRVTILNYLAGNICLPWASCQRLYGRAHGFACEGRTADLRGRGADIVGWLWTALEESLRWGLPSHANKSLIASAAEAVVAENPFQSKGWRLGSSLVSRSRYTQTPIIRAAFVFLRFQFNSKKQQKSPPVEPRGLFVGRTPRSSRSLSDLTVRSVGKSDRFLVPAALRRQGQ